MTNPTAARTGALSSSAALDRALLLGELALADLKLALQIEATQLAIQFQSRTLTTAPAKLATVHWRTMWIGPSPSSKSDS
jgi:hypothetical protein